MDYKSMELSDLVEYINLQLGSGRNFTEIASKDFSCNESTLRKRLTGKKLYKRVGNKYVRQYQTSGDNNKNIEIINKVTHSVRQGVTNGNDKNIIAETEVRNISISKNDSEKLLGLINNYELIVKMLDEYKISKDNIYGSSGLVVELPTEKKKDFRITLRLNDVIYEEFKEFADKNKQFTIKELVSQALKEFIEKYK